jgi:DNA end-binding protein Ku
VSDDELEKIRIESTHTIDIDSFVPRAEIDDRYLESPYYMAPTDQVGQEAFTVIRDAMREKKMVGIARVVLTRREHVVMLEPFDKGLLATTLRYPYELREHGEYFEDIPDLKMPAEMKKLAAHIVDTKAGHFEPKSFEDHYEKALVELLKSKESGKPVETIGEEKAPPRVINLMDALKASIKAGAKKPAAASTETRRPAKKKAGAR